jgi:hypothetical protein
MAKRVADIVVETLQAAGVKHCWGVPGDTLNFVTDAIRRSGCTSDTRRSPGSQPGPRQCSPAISQPAPDRAGRAACISSTGCSNRTATARRWC